MQYSFVTHTRHNVAKNNFSINLAKSTAVSLKTPPKSVSDTGNPYYVACLITTQCFRLDRVPVKYVNLSFSLQNCHVYLGT